MLDNVGSPSQKRCLRHLADLDLVVGDKSVTSFNDLERGLGFTYTGLAQDKDTFTVYLDKNAVHRYTGSKLHLKELNEL